jgi:ferritin
MEYEVVETPSNTVYSTLLNQLTLEQNNSRVYRTFAGIADLQSFTGAAKYFHSEADGETEHFKMIFDFMCDRDMNPVMQSLPEIEFNKEMSLLEMFCQAVQAEQNTLQSLYLIKKVSFDMADYLTFDWIQGLILKQREEIKQSIDWRNKFSIANESPAALLFLDNELEKD